MESRTIWIDNKRIKELWNSNSDSITCLKTYISSSDSVKENNSSVTTSRNRILNNPDGVKSEMSHCRNGILKKLGLIPSAKRMFLKCLTYSPKKSEQDLFDTLVRRLSSLVKSNHFGFGDYHMGWIHSESKNDKDLFTIYYMKYHMIRGTLRDLIKTLHPLVMFAKLLKYSCEDKDSNVSHEVLYGIYGKDFVPQVLKFETMLIDDNEQLSKGYNSVYLQFISELVSAMDYLHVKSLVHNNMKPENVLVTDVYHLKLSDPSLFANCVHQYYKMSSCVEESQSETSSSQKTRRPFKTLGCQGYRPPEFLPQFYADKRFNRKIINPMTNLAGDLFSLGVIIYELLSGLNPISDSAFFKKFEKVPKEDLYAMVALHPGNNNHYVFSQEAPQYLASQQYLPLVKRLIHPDPSVRPAGKIIKTLAIFYGVNFQCIEEKSILHKVDRLLEQLSIFLKNKKIDQKLKGENIKAILENCLAIRPPILPTTEFPVLRRCSSRSSKKLQWDGNVEFDPKKPIRHLSNAAK